MNEWPLPTALTRSPVRRRGADDFGELSGGRRAQRRAAAARVWLPAQLGQAVDSHGTVSTLHVCAPSIDRCTTRVNGHRNRVRSLYVSRSRRWDVLEGDCRVATQTSHQPPGRAAAPGSGAGSQRGAGPADARRVRRARRRGGVRGADHHPARRAGRGGDRLGLPVLPGQAGDRAGADAAQPGGATWSASASRFAEERHLRTGGTRSTRPSTSTSTCTAPCPGFRTLHFGDVVDLHLLDERAGQQRGHRRAARARCSSSRFGIADAARLQFVLAIAVEAADALIKMAFRRDARGRPGRARRGEGADQGLPAPPPLTTSSDPLSAVHAAGKGSETWC